MLIKSPKELNEIEEGGKRLAEVLRELGEFCRVGMSTFEVDQKAEELILKQGGVPAFKGYTTGPQDPPFPATICASLNDELVHGIPDRNRILKDGDIFSIDIGMRWPGPVPRGVQGKGKGLFTDTALTVTFGKVSKEVEKLLSVTRESLERGIAAAQPGRSIAGIGRAVEDYVKSQGRYGIVRDLVGHGVGHAVHEDPQVPNYYDKKLETQILRPGMVIAIEPMIALGDWHVISSDDGWTIKMADGSICAHFEHTVIITETGNVVVTRRVGER